MNSEDRCTLYTYISLMVFGLLICLGWTAERMYSNYAEKEKLIKAMEAGYEKIEERDGFITWKKSPE